MFRTFRTIFLSFSFFIFGLSAHAGTFSTQTGVISFTEAGNGEPLVLIHAFPTDQRIWQPQLNGLKDYFHVITVDLWGFGRSAVTDGQAITMADYASEIKQLLDYLNISSAIIGGESMGGYVALAFLKKYPGSVIGLILSNTQAIADTSEIKAKREATADEVLSSGTERLFREFRSKVFSNQASEEARSLLDTILEEQSPAGIASALRGMALRPDASFELSETDYPVLIITGTEDKVIPPTESENMSSAARNSRLIKIKGAGHLANLENSDAWNKAVIGAFYQGVSQ